jgi:hypothetical protein
VNSSCIRGLISLQETPDFWKIMRINKKKGRHPFFSGSGKMLSFVLQLLISLSCGFGYSNNNNFQGLELPEQALSCTVYLTPFGSDSNTVSIYNSVVEGNINLSHRKWVWVLWNETETMHKHPSNMSRFLASPARLTS